jgi:hypothetical protein
MAYTTINKGTDYFNTKLYTGNGSTGHAITGIGFQPDWVWIKSRDQADNHNIFDVVRGASKGIQSNSTDAEYTASSVHESFDTDGFTLGDNGQVNGSSENFVSWNWLAGGTASSNTDGSITSSVSANTTSGFSIVSWNEASSGNQTIGHGLGVTPDMMILKRRNDGTTSWLVYHKSIGNTGAVFLNDTASTSVSSTYWNNTSPTNSSFTLSSSWNSNASYNWIGYCFAEKKGYSKFGSYTGAGAGAYIYTGFKPAYVLVKAYNDGTKHWVCWDNKRANTFNPQNERILTNTNNVAYESNTRAIDFLSNGFKMRDNGTDSSAGNVSGTPYLYMAFAEAPVVGTNNVPSTAR